MQLKKWAPLGWALWIFGTSCTVVRRDLFIAWVARHLPFPALRQTWTMAWLGFGIVVVKAYHVGEFAALCFLLTGALRALKLSFERALPLAALGCLLFAASDEWHQTFVPGRGGTWVDVCIDAFGIGLACAWLVSRAAKARRSRVVAPESS